MPYKLFLDDIRNPPDDSWIVARSYNELIKIVSERGAPDHVSFDHDLGIESYGTVARSGYDAAWWFVNNGIVLKSFTVHSANPVGAENIRRLLENYAKFSYNKE
jgi:hypothetical protein